MTIRQLWFIGLLLANVSFAQKSSRALTGTTWNELRQAHYGSDSTASAAILSDVGKLAFIYDDHLGFRVERNRTVKIKIYTTEALHWGEVGIGYYDGGYRQEIVTNIEGVTYNEENGQIVPTRLDKDAIYQNDLDEHQRVKKFALPNVRAGSVIEYTYTIQSPYLLILRDWQFQYEIPVRYSEFSARIPGFYEYAILHHGYTELSVNEAEVTKNKKQLGRYTYNDLKFRWAAKNIPAFRDESFISAKDDYLSRLSFQLAKENFPGRSTRTFMETWPKLSGDLLSLSDFGKYLKRKDGLDLAQQLAVSATTQLEKARKIYQYINTTLAWDGTYSLTPDQSPKQVLANRTGNSTDINIVLRNMLSAVGIVAEPVLLSTRGHGKVNGTYPRLNQFNYSIVRAVLDNQEYLIDGTDPDLPLGTLPLYCINGFGLIADEKEERWVALESNERYHTETLVFASFDSASYELKATVSKKEKGYAALYARKEYRANKEEVIGFTQQDFTIKNLDDIDRDVLISFNTPYPATSADEFLYIDPFRYSTLDENPFKAVDRQHPIDYSYRRTYKYIFNLVVPEGYTVEEAPTTVEYALEDQSVQFVFRTMVNDLSVQLLSLVQINQATITADHYPQLQALYQTLVTKHQENIVLRKK